MEEKRSITVMPPRKESEASSLPRPVQPAPHIQSRINALKNGEKNGSSGALSGVPDRTGKREGQDSPLLQRDEEILQRYKEQLRKRGMANGASSAGDVDGFPREKSVRNGDADASSPRPAPTGPVVAPPQPAQAPQSPAPRGGLPEPGAILRLGTGEVAIYHRDVPNKNYQVVLVLNPDGTLSPEGVALSEGPKFDRIGLVPNEQLEFLLRTLTWNRDHIVFHLDSFTYAHLIIHPTARVSQPAPAPQPQISRSAEWPSPSQEAPTESRAPVAKAAEPPRGKMQRGQRFRISFSKDKEWEAVFWCEDEQGPVVAHKTQGVWSLMHLDLGRFKDTVALLNMLTEPEQVEIEKALRHSLG
jgi:hypothetical protein